MNRRQALQGLIGIAAGLALASPALAADQTFKVTNNSGADISKLYVASSADDEEWDEEDEVLKGKALKKGASTSIKLHSKKAVSHADFALKVGSKGWFKVDISKAKEVILLPKGKFQVK